jgi:hypothetical protein
MVLLSTFGKFLFEMVSSSDVYLTLVCFTCVLTILRVTQMFQNLRDLPPGPWGLPFLGFLPYLTGVPHLQFCQLSQKYGSIFSTRLGSHLVVVLSDYKAIRNAFRKEAFSARPETEIKALMEGYGQFSFYFLLNILKFILFLAYIYVVIIIILTISSSLENLQV